MPTAVAVGRRQSPVEITAVEASQRHHRQRLLGERRRRSRILGHRAEALGRGLQITVEERTPGTLEGCLVGQAVLGWDLRVGAVGLAVSLGGKQILPRGKARLDRQPVLGLTLEQGLHLLQCRLEPTQLVQANLDNI